MAGSATFRKIDEFSSDREEWPQYVQHLGHYFDANGITDADQRQAILLSVIGPTTFKLVRNLVSPANLKEKSFTELVQALTSHYSPMPLVIVQ